MSKIKLPECGMFIGVPVYMDRADYIFQTSGPYYTSWVSEDHDPEWYIQKAIDDNQGNLLCIWDGGATTHCLKAMAYWQDMEGAGFTVPEPDWKKKEYLVAEDWPEIEKQKQERYGAGFYRFVKNATDKGFYVYSIYSDAKPQWVDKIVSNEKYIGYNAGEAFSFDLNSGEAKVKEEEQQLFRAKKIELTKNDMNLSVVAEKFGNNIRNYFTTRRASGWKNFLITSGSFHMDYEIAAGGNDIIPHVEGFAFHNLNFGMSMCRGIYKQCDLPLWGCYLAHEHYSFVPYASKFKFMSLDASHYLSYLNGSKVTVQESGTWWQQSDHVPDTKMHNVPKFDAGSIRHNVPKDYAHLVKDARKHYKYLNYDSAICRRYRKSVSEFYDYIKKNGTPEGQPEITVAALKGRFDFCSQSFAPNCAIAGAYKFAETNPFWFENMPERGWETFRRTFLPLTDSYGQYRNFYFSGTPYGLVDVVSFSAPMTSEFLLKNYKALLMTGWNSATDEQYEILKEYVRGGGTLFASISHFSKNLTRDFITYRTDELVNGGDLSELCGVKVLGRGKQLYWAVATGENDLGFAKRKRFGAFYTHMGEIEITSKDVEIQFVQDEEFKPFVLKHKYGQGCVYFLNSWEPPGALDNDWAPGSIKTSAGIVGDIYSAIAEKSRGSAYITDDGVSAGDNCRAVTYSYFPSNGRTYLMNCDFSKSRRVKLHVNGKVTEVKLKPAEFTVV